MVIIYHGSDGENEENDDDDNDEKLEQRKVSYIHLLTFFLKFK